ncbi:MAG: hypothetical protein ACE364_10340 [Chlorobiota bacterium]
MTEFALELLAHLFIELIPEVIRVLVKSIGVLFIKVLTFTTTPIRNLYHDESKTVQSYVVGTIVLVAVIVLIILSLV